MQYWFTLFALSQGCAVLGLTLFIFSYYIPKNKEELSQSFRWHVLVISLSYILLTLATVKTATFGFYGWGDIWYWIVTVAYISGDISLVFIFRTSVKKHKLAKLKKEFESKNQL